MIISNNTDINNSPIVNEWKIIPLSNILVPFVILPSCPHFIIKYVVYFTPFTYWRGTLCDIRTISKTWLLYRLFWCKFILFYKSETTLLVLCPAYWWTLLGLSDVFFMVDLWIVCVIDYYSRMWVLYCDICYGTCLGFTLTLPWKP